MLRPAEIVMDSFAGGGGATTGIERALGRPVDVAINHDPEAIALHAANHPATKHFCQNVWQVDPRVVTEGRPVGLAWFSPDCKHFSKAKGGKPVEKRIRDLAWVVVHYARLVKPRVIMLENVEEFQEWGPLIEVEGGKMMPCPLQKGMEFRRWVAALKALGYKIEWRQLRACDYGAPTIRKRLFVIARRDGLPIVWPAPSHGDPKRPETAAKKLLPWRTAAEIIDWSLPCPSIFLTSAEARAIGVKRPLAGATEARIAHGIDRYVLKSARPFIVSLTHQGGTRVESVDEPVKTITAAHRGEKALIQPFLAGVGGRMGQSAARPVDKPYHTATAKPDTVLVTPFLAGAGGPVYGGKPKPTDAPMNTLLAEDHTALIAPTLVETGYGEREGQSPRAPGIDKPLGTVAAGAGHHAVVAAHVVKFRGDSKGSDMGEPLPTVTAGPAENPAGAAHALGVCAAYLAQHNAGFYEGVGRDPDKPLSTVMQSGSHQAVVAAQMVQLRGSNVAGRALDAPAPTIAAEGQHEGLAAVSLVKYYGEGSQAQGVDEPLHTVTAKPRFAAAEADLAAGSLLTEEQRYAAWWVARFIEAYLPPPPVWWPAARPAMLKVGPFAIVDIGMRMLKARELYRAQGFPANYKIDIEVPRQVGGKVKRTVMKPLPADAKNRMCGNSVSPDHAAALVAANFAADPGAAAAASAAP